MEMRDAELGRGYRKAWFLVLLGVIYIVLFFVFATNTSPPGHDVVEWDMGGTSFVPASSMAADGYYLPVTEPDWLDFDKGGSQ